MKKVITAMNEPKFNEKIKNEFLVIGKDIQYKEGILEILEKNPDIEIIFFNNNLEGEIENEELFKRIKKINPKIEIKKYSGKHKENKQLKFLRKEDIKRKEKSKNGEKLICSVYGEEGSGKTIISAIIAKKLSKNKKTLLIDFNKEKDFIFLFNMELNKKIKNMKIVEKEKIKKLEEGKEYLEKEDNVIIDLGNKNNKKEKEKILKQCNKNIIILQPNILRIRNIEKIINQYIKEFKISKNQIYILINKKNKNSINKEIINNLFNEIEIIGEISLTDNFEKLINNNLGDLNFCLEKKIDREINEIINNIKIK